VAEFHGYADLRAFKITLIETGFPTMQTRPITFMDFPPRQELPLVIFNGFIPETLKISLDEMEQDILKNGILAQDVGTNVLCMVESGNRGWTLFRDVALDGAYFVGIPFVPLGNSITGDWYQAEDLRKRVKLNSVVIKNIKLTKGNKISKSNINVGNGVRELPCNTI